MYETAYDAWLTRVPDEPDYSEVGEALAGGEIIVRYGRLLRNDGEYRIDGDELVNDEGYDLQASLFGISDVEFSTDEIIEGDKIKIIINDAGIYQLKNNPYYNNVFIKEDEDYKGNKYYYIDVEFADALPNTLYFKYKDYEYRLSVDCIESIEQL